MSVRIESPGLLTTVQDLGRTGWRHVGVARCGALDPDSARLANRLVGNRDDCNVLEMTLQGPTLRLTRPLRLAVCGARMCAKFEADDGTQCRLPDARPLTLPAGRLQIGALHGGARAWLAAEGGFDVATVLGSGSTDLRGGFGGHEGRALRVGDTLSLRAAQAHCDAPRVPAWWIGSVLDDMQQPIRYVPSNHPDAAALASRAWHASSRSDRQGLRLQGDAMAGTRAEEISAAVAPGTIQLPPDGQPIVLLADAQTVGGYPRLGHVIAADLPRLAQLRPGDPCRFTPCDLETATRLACAARVRIARISLMIHHQLARGNFG